MVQKSFGSAKVFYLPYSRDELVEKLQDRVAALGEVLPLQRVTLFGSWAAGRATAFSDIDLLVVYAGRPRDDAYSIVRKTIDLRGLEPHVYAEGEARQIAGTLERMTAGGIELL